MAWGDPWPRLSCGCSAFYQDLVRSCPFSGHGVGGDVRVSQGFPSSFKFFGLVLFTSHPSIPQGSSCPGD